MSEIERTKTGSIKGVGGRPPGSPNKTTLFKQAMREGFEKLLETEGEKVFRACVDKALEGDTTAMKIIMDRVMPVADVTGAKASGNMQVVINVDSMTPNITLMDTENVIDISDPEKDVG